MSYIYNLLDTWNDGATTFTAVKMNVTDTASNAASLLMDLQVGSASKFSVSKIGALTALTSVSSSSGSFSAYVVTPTILVSTSNPTIAFGGSSDAILTRDAPNTLALRNSTAAQAFNIYNTYTSSTSFERYSVDWITTANLVIVGPNKGSGGGTQRVQRLSYLEDGGAGSTTPSLGTTCPAASATIKSWIKVITSDGTTAYVPCWA